MRLPRLPFVRLRNPLVPPLRTARSGVRPTGTFGDGRADPGEIVWAWVPYEEDASRGKDRPSLVLEVDGDDVLVLPMTTVDHDRDEEQEARAGRFWMDIGTGSWDSRGRPSEVRLNRIVRLRRDDVRREGAALDPEVFARVVAAAEQYR
jgi:hypothetical protein